MTRVKRHTLYPDHPDLMVPNDEGSWILYADYAALAKRVESLEFDVEAMDKVCLRDGTEISRLREALDEIESETQDVRIQGIAVRALRGEE